MKLEIQQVLAGTERGSTLDQAALLPACIHSQWTSIITTDDRDEDTESMTPLSHNEFNVSQDNKPLNYWSHKRSKTVHNLLTYEKNKKYTQVYDYFFFSDNTSHWNKA